jgi:hypothetical protein
MLRAALALASRGMHVFPCRGKFPVTEHGFYNATRDPEQIKEWWALHRNSNIGIATGAVSGIFVIDIDSPDAEAALRKLESELGLLPVTIEVITGKGRHLYFRHPGKAIKCSRGEIAPDIDCRGDGGYVIAPPSRHLSGRRYCWSVDTGNALAEAPDWLIQRVSAGGNGRTLTPPEEWTDIAAAGVSEGARNVTVTRLAGHLLRRTVDPLLALEILLGWNDGRCRPPLPEADVRKIVNSIAGRELKRRNGG